jgi:antitoxin VapB
VTTARYFASADVLAKAQSAGYVYPNWIYEGIAPMASSTVFTSNRSQAVRLPKAVAFPEDVHQVDILKIGRSRVIVPQGRRWDDLFQNGPRASDDFMVERAQPPAEEREQF